MSQVTVPSLPESVPDATIAKWHKATGDSVVSGDMLVELETDKVMLEVVSEYDGVIEDILQGEGQVVVAGDVLAKVALGAVPAVKETKSAPVDAEQRSLEKHSPTVRRLLAENHLTGSEVAGTGKGGRLTKQDILNYISTPVESSNEVVSSIGAPRRVPMSRLRAKVAERLNESQQNAVILTTFNEVDLTKVMSLRKQHQELFQEKHAVKLGFMSFFVKAAVAALKEFPIVNAAVEGQDILYHDYCDIGVAIAAPRGLVVPVIRGAEHLGMADIEKSIKAFAMQAKENKLSLQDMTGGTFTITNGGTFGSMMSTPIINPPQSAILGMHNIVKRPIVVDDAVVIRPMMYLALSYDHRIIDGSDSVRFLVMIKDLLENPARLLLNI